MMSGVLTCALFLTVASAPPEPPTMIFLLAGQSNMEGLGEVARLSKRDLAIPANVLAWLDGAWQPMKVQGATFGPEVSFAHALATALPKERIGIVKYAKGGTAIAEWSPTDEKSLYAELVKRCQAAKEAAPDARLAAMLWMQGERDSRQTDTATAYGKNLQELVKAARRDVGEETLAFLCGQVNPPYPYAQLVRKAQAALPKQVKRASLISTNGLEKNGDNLHYSTRGQLELGRRYARAFLDLERSRDK